MATEKDVSKKAELKDAAMTVGNIRNKDYAPVKTSGVKIRGTGAAKKGVTARGPMA